MLLALSGFYTGNIENTDVALSMSNTFVRSNKELQTNTINTVGDNDWIFSRNGVEYFRLDGANEILNVAIGRAISSGNINTNNLRSRSNSTDTVWFGRGADGTSQVEIFRYEYANEQLNFNTALNFLVPGLCLC